MQKVFCYVMALCLAALAWSAPETTSSKKKTGSTKKSSSSSGVKKSSSKKTTTSKTASSSSSRKKPVTKTTWRNRQSQPTQERYKQIQEALASKGYMRQEDATGVWNGDSTAALARFQADQSIEGSGKINSLSLIALGLGPKHEDAAMPPKPVPPQQQENPAGSGH